MDWLDFARHAAAGYDLSPEAATPLEGGRINLNLRVSTPTGIFVLRSYPESRTFDQVRFEMDVLTHLHGLGARVPEPLHATDGSVVSTLDGAPMAWLRRVPGDALTVDEGLGISPDELFDVLGPVRTGLDRFEPPFSPVRETRTFAHSFRTLYGALCDHERSAMASELQSRFRLAERWERVAQLPTGVAHGDVHAGNLLRESPGQPLWLVEFDDVHVGWRALDWVLPALELSIDHEGTWDVERYEALLEPWRRSWSTAEEREAEPELASLLLLKRAAIQHVAGSPLHANRYLVTLLGEQG